MNTRVIVICLLGCYLSLTSCAKKESPSEISHLHQDSISSSVVQSDVVPQTESNTTQLKFIYQFTDKEIQKISGDIAIIPFGSGYPINVGTLSEGKLEVDLSDIKINTISNTTIEEHLGHIGERLTFSCPNFTDEKIDIAQSGSFVLIQDEMITADLFPVSDIRLENWLFSGGHEAPLKASYYELLYTDTGFSLTTQCDNSSKGTNEKDQHFTFDLDLKKGFNLIEYHIEETALPKDINDFVIPSKVTITNKNIDYKNIQWVFSISEGC